MVRTAYDFYESKIVEERDNYFDVQERHFIISKSIDIDDVRSLENGWERRKERQMLTIH